MNSFAALIKREILDGKNGYVYAPLVLAGLMVALTFIGIAGADHIIKVNDIELSEVHNLSSAMEKLRADGKGDEIPAAISLLYFGLSSSVWMAFPFAVFFSLLGALYEERRDKSILFWKSMPVSDVQEVLAKLVAAIFVTFLIYLGISIATQIVMALILSIVMLFQGGNMLDMWPLGTMIPNWFAFIPNYVVGILWGLPMLAWLLLVSSFAPRMTFMYAVLPPVIVIVLEEMLFDSSRFANWVGMHLGGWIENINWQQFTRDIDGPSDVLANMNSFPLMDALSISLSSPSFWGGIALAGLFVWGAVEFRKRAI